ncbi:hypothetical protein DZC78_02630 [Olleya aquimaris]|uniref:Tetratricopeptide repeat protein n=1 Tax=Olleya sediminilitoris TaxID=2795739 RepID=A0ABS1WIG5_9FLAO|nr:hypothetical protein [Olleya sediminilitoris]AXO79318.1 hypothetical protein DZC78_02630 [Olleya aquimaris]MBL7558915.1 hypothetical protein [Olleya sediminilitoris]
MKEDMKWFEEMTQILFKEYKTLFVSKIVDYEKESIKKIALLRNQYLDYDDDDGDDFVVVDYILGIYSKAQLKVLKNKIDESAPSDVLENAKDLWGPPLINKAWENNYQYSSDFELFQHCTVLATVGQKLLTDADLKPYFMKGASVYLKCFGDFNEECTIPMYKGVIPESPIREKVIADFVTTDENKKLLLSLWNKAITEPGISFFKSIGLTPLVNYPNQSDISKELFKARKILFRVEDEGGSKEASSKAAIASLEPYLEAIIPFKGRKTKKIKEAIQEHESACNHLGSWYGRLKDYDNAEKWWRRCYQILPTQTGTLNLCLVYKNDKPNYPEFLKITEHLTSIYNKLSSYSQLYAWEYLATAYVVNGEINKACNTFTTLIKENPEEDIAYYKTQANKALDILFEQNGTDEKLKNKLLSVFEA